MMFLSFLNLSNDFKHHVHLNLPVLQNLLETSLGNVFFFPSVPIGLGRENTHGAD